MSGGRPNRGGRHGLAAFGELYTSPRMYGYAGALAPKGQDVMAKGATTRPDGLPGLNRAAATRSWRLLTTIGLLSAASGWLFNRWVENQEAKETTAEP
ncbi:MAG: hypothetical protein KJ062_10105 [Thermoanaerobaculia bacterium]|nr:hypothetical protein [Thermoanaerobaculia bacterium]